MKLNAIKALVGLLIVLIIPVVLVSVIYLSPKTKRVDLPVLQADSLQLEFLTDSVDVSNDIKVYYRMDSCMQDIVRLQDLANKTADYPQPRPEYKEPHPRILYVSRCEHDNPFFYTINPVSTEKEILLLDRLNRVRGEYNFSDSSLHRLDIDIQHLMAETYHANKKAGRSMTF